MKKSKNLPIPFIYLTLCAMLAALSVLGKLLNIGTDIFRISFENTPVIAAGLITGPVGGLATGVVADLVGCLVRGYSINPIITFGMGLIGLIPGIIKIVKKEFGGFLSYLVVCLISYLIASVIVKSIGLSLYYGTDIKVLLFRVPMAAANALLDAFIIYELSKPAKKLLKKHENK